MSRYDPFAFRRARKYRKRYCIKCKKQLTISQVMACDECKPSCLRKDINRDNDS